MTHPHENETYDATLTIECWTCLEAIRDAWYSGMFALLALGQAERLRQAIRAAAPGIKGDWLRTRAFGDPVAISISKEAVARYTPSIHQFVAFGCATRMAGAYEAYVRQLAEASPPGVTDLLKSAHPKANGKFGFNYVHPAVGRGVSVLAHLSGGAFVPLNAYAPCLDFLFGLRNVNVHDNGLATAWLVELSKSEHVNASGPLVVGTPVPWRVEWALQLQHLLVELLASADPHVAVAQGFSTETRRSWWKEQTTT